VNAAAGTLVDSSVLLDVFTEDLRSVSFLGKSCLRRLRRLRMVLP
jgi:hypothetical protein